MPFGSFLIVQLKPYVVGSNETTSLLVQLAINGSDGHGLASMCISNAPFTAATCPAWVPYATNESWELASGPDGPRAVYVMLRDIRGDTPPVAMTQTIYMREVRADPARS